EHGSMQVVRSAFADDVDLCRAESLIRGIRSARNLEFLDSILRQNHRGSNKGGIGIHKSVERVVIPLRTPAVHADRIALALPHRALFTAYRHGTGTDQEQLHEIAAVQR